MSAAAEFLADIMDICAHIKTLAAKDAEVDFRKRDPIDSVTIHVDEPRFPLNHLPLSGQFIKGNTSVLFR